MKIIKIDNKEILNSFLKEEKYSQFLQSWEWGEFQESLGNKIFRIAVEKDGIILAVATFIRKNIALRKNYFYCPRGWIINKTKISNFKFQIKDIEAFLFNEIKKIAQKENAIFLRYEPLFKTENSKFKIQNSISLQPAKTLILDLSESEEELLKEMHQKTRYNIRLAKKKGVEIVEGSIDDFDSFWKLMNKTSDRDGFRIHSKKYYRKMLEIDFVKIFFAKFEDRYIASGLFSFFGDTVTYIHGASDNELRNVMAPYLLQWQISLRAKEVGYRYYDFYGIDENKWPGVTRFKRGFGGFELDYPGTLDIVFDNFFYRAYELVRKIRRIF